MYSQQNILDNNLLTKTNQSSTLADDNSYSTIDPIHSNYQSFLSLSKCKQYISKPAFGTRANRQIHQLNSKKQSDIVAYSRINYSKNQKYNDRYQQIKAKLTPFMSTSGRFSNNKLKNPGPGQYNFPQIFKNKNQVKKSHGILLSPFKRWDNKDDKLFNSNYAEEKQYLWNQKENYQSNSYQLQQKIKQKRQKVKQKMSILRDQMKKPSQNFKPILKRMGFSEDEQKKQQNQEPLRLKQKNKLNHQKSANLKQITSKYLPTMDYNFQRQQFRAGGVIKNFKQKYNNQPMFITKNQNLFSAYIVKNQIPGPGYYQKKTKKSQRKDSFSVKNYFH